MKSRHVGLAGACLLAALTAARVEALTLITPPPPALRIANADLVVVGKVTGYEDKTVKGETYKGDARDMRIATVKVSQTLLGKEVKEVRVGYFPPPPAANPKGNGPVLRVNRAPTVQLKEGEEYCLFLTKHPTHKGVYWTVAWYDGIAKAGNDNFAKQVEEVKKAAKLLAKPDEGLKSKNADDRFLTAALLVTRYRNRGIGAGAAKEDEVSADQSKLILEALAGADWAQKPAPGTGSQGTPLGVFYSLGLTDKDGWKPPREAGRVFDEAKKWCKDHAGTYRIKRFVREEKAASSDR
jgi:hypothetical protein